ncbi:MAG: ABC transporter substrate-binding protein [Eubacterium sp.]|nr:ABC transporter substrate-binding protein [Eubacterium sp.]
MSKEQKKRSLRVFAIVVTLALALGGCSKPSDPAESATDGQSTQPPDTQQSSQSAPAAGGNDTLVIAAKTTPQGIDTSYHNALESMQAFRNVMDTLVAFKVQQNANGEWTQDFSTVEPRLAESWSLSEDGRVMTYKLKQGVISHHGNELTADDVKWTFDRQIELKAVGHFFATVAGRLETTDDIQVIDKYTVSFTTAEPNPIALTWATHSFNGIFDSVEAKKHATEQDPWATEWLANNSCSFGPYKIEKWAAGQEVIFAAHEQYHGDQPAMKRIIYREIPSSANRMALLQSGEVDIAEQLTPKERNELENAEGVKVHKWDGNVIAHFEMNVNAAPFDNKLVRQAMNYAFPYEETLEAVYLGTAKQATSVTPSTYPGFFGDSTFAYNTDLEKAKALLAEAGYANGFTTDLYIDAGVQEHELIAILMRTSLEQIGVTLNIVKLPTGDFYAQLLKNELPMFVWQDMPGVPDGGFGIALWVVGGSTVNHSNFNDPELNELYKFTTSTLDEQARNDAFLEMQKILLEECPWIYVAETGWQIPARSNVDGLTWFPLNDIRWNYVVKN